MLYSAVLRYKPLVVYQEAGQLLVSMLATAPALAAELGELLDALGESWVVQHHTLMVYAKTFLRRLGWSIVCALLQIRLRLWPVAGSVTRRLQGEVEIQITSIYNSRLARPDVQADKFDVMPIAHVTGYDYNTGRKYGAII